MANYENTEIIYGTLLLAQVAVVSVERPAEKEKEKEKLLSCRIKIFPTEIIDRFRKFTGLHGQSRKQILH